MTTETSRIEDFTDLRVWQAAMDLCVNVYAFTKLFPKDERYALAKQLERAAISVPSNISEGHTRAHLKEYLQFVNIARGSLAEVRTQVMIAARLGYAPPERSNALVAEVLAVARQLTALRNALDRKLNHHPSPIPHHRNGEAP